MMQSNESRIRKCFFLTYDEHKIEQVNSAYVAALAINCFLMPPTVMLNILLLCALRGTHSLHKPSSLLLYSLSVSDLLAGLIFQPAYVVKKVGEFNKDFDVYCRTALLTYTSGTLLTTVSFLTLTTIAIDRYFIVTSGINYPLRMNYSRVTRIVVFIWMAAIASVVSQFFLDRSSAFKVIVAIMAVSVAITTFCYTTAMCKLKKQQSSIQNISTSANIQRYRKSTVTMMIVFLLYVACYIPYMATVLVAMVLGESAHIWAAESIVSVLLLGNGCVNPSVLFLRMGEIRQAGLRSVNLVRLSLSRGRKSEAVVPLGVIRGSNTR